MPYVSTFYPGERVFDDTVGASDELKKITLVTGCIPRDFGRDPVKVNAGNEVVLIPMSEWDDRLSEMDKTKSRLSDIRMTGNNGSMIPSLNQGSFGFCVDDTTEVLTPTGWVPYPKYNWTDPLATVNPQTHRMEFQTPFDRHVYEYDGEMIHSTHGRMDFAVTPDHEMYVRKWDEKAHTLSPNFSFVKAKDLGWYSGMLPAPTGWAGTELHRLEVPDDRQYTGDDFFALLGLIVSDGYAGGTDNTRPWVSFACFRDNDLPGVRDLALRNGFHETPSRPGVFVRYSAHALADWIRANCYTSSALGATNKRVPDLVKVASVRQIGVFLNYFNDRSRSSHQYFSTSKRLIDDLQELLMRVGKRSTISERGPRTSHYAGKAINGGPSFTLTVGTSGLLSLDRKKNLERDRYKGLVYCASVPNHTLLTRRNGSVLISSNCWNHSGTAGAQIIRAVQGLPYVPLSAFAACAIINGFQDGGGWGSAGLQFGMKRGYPSQAKWPQGSIARQYDNPETWADAAKYKVTEGVIDLDGEIAWQNLTFQAVASLLLSRIPVVTDFMWWGHSVLALDLVKLADGKYGIRILNSWGDTWETNGMTVLTGQKAIPDGAVAPRVLTAA